MTPPGCFVCGSMEHWDLNSSCPEREPPTEGATDRKAHEARIEKYKRWFFDDSRIDIQQKRKLIEMECARFKRATARPKERKAS